MRHPSRSLLCLTGLVLAGSLLAACGAGEAGPVDVGDSPGQTAPATDAPGAPDSADEDAAAADGQTPADDTADDTAADGGTTQDFHVRPEGQELVLEVDGHVSVLATLPDDGESVFRYAAVRPGGDSQDLVVVAVTSAEGTYDLRWLEVIGGEPGELKLFGDAYDLSDGTDEAFGERVPTLVWSPDGASLAWLEPVEDGAMLRTIGWSYGPGTGDPADDNASFGLEDVPAAADAVSWDASAGQDSVIVAEAAGGDRFDIVLERQGDGALALKGAGPAAN